MTTNPYVRDTTANNLNLDILVENVKADEFPEIYKRVFDAISATGHACRINATFGET